MFKRAFIPALLVLFVSVNVMAQMDDPWPHGMRFRNLDLTEEQQAQIEEITTATMKEHLSVRSKLQTLKAELDELMIADTPNQGAIHRKIEEMSDLRAEMQKAQIDTRLRIRGLLTEEQRVRFDAMGMHGPGMRMKRPGGHPGRMEGMRGGRPGMRGGMRRFGDAGIPLDPEEEIDVAEF